jgi:hypothetical protein
MKLSVTKIPFILTNSTEDPSDVNYEKFVYALVHVITDNTGRVSSITFYQLFDTQTKTPSIPVVKERYTFTTNVLNFAESRTKEVDYYDIEGNITFTKVEPVKYYSFSSSKVEGNRRRENLINDATGLLINLVGLPNAIAFSSPLTIELYAYQFGNNTQLLKDAVTNSVESYMTQSVKDAILNILNNA